MAAKPDARQLPKKENDLFKSIAKHYETKQYKKGLKVRPRLKLQDPHPLAAV